jgi:hypothetical protein
MRHAYILLVSAVVMAALGAGYLTYLHTAPREAPIVRNTTVDRERIRQVLREEGGFKAYEVLAQELATEDMAVQHIGAHMFGNALYDLDGMNAIAVCDDRFLYGCFHSVLMAAIGDKGLDAIGELQKVCDTVLPDLRGQCEHGIGHGIVGTLGFGTEEIEKALNLCDSELPHSPPIDGCKGGVLMENIQRLMHDGTIHPRAFEAGEKWEPCDALDAKYSDACAFWQPLWWVSSIIPIPADVELFAAQMGSWCTEAPGGISAEQYCVSGIGNIIYVLIGTSTERTAAVCAATTDNSKNLYGCHETAARRYLYSLPQDIALRACDGLHPDTKAQCRSNALRGEGSAARAK